MITIKRFYSSAKWVAFAVAASANFPCVLLTLYWKRCSTGGIVAGMIIGTVAAVGLTLVSPNVTYPKAVRAASQKVFDGEVSRRGQIAVELASADPGVVKQGRIDQVTLDKAVQKGALHRNTGARKKSRAAGIVGSITQASAPAETQAAPDSES